jgi:hypothetical protein
LRIKEKETRLILHEHDDGDDDDDEEEEAELLHVISVRIMAGKTCRSVKTSSKIQR